MQAFIEEINQALILRDQKIETRLVLSLPNGRKISATVSDDDLKVLVEARTEEQMAEQPTEPVGTVAVAQGMVDELADPEMEDLARASSPEVPGGSDLVVWASLPDDYLAPEMKQLLTELGAAPVMSVTDLVGLVNEISQAEGLMEQVPEPAAPQPLMTHVPEGAPPYAPVQPQPSQAQSAIGRVVVQRSKPARTVPKDEYGYPIVPGMEQDPGEVAIPDADEDGVGQM